MLHWLQSDVSASRKGISYDKTQHKTYDNYNLPGPAWRKRTWIINL